MIDKTELNVKIREISNEILADMQLMNKEELEDNMRYFAKKSKDIAESILEEYMNQVSFKFTESSSAITDMDKLSQFVDLKNGYQQQMLRWIEKHLLEVKEVVFVLPDNPADRPVQKNISPQTVLEAGTIIAVGLFIFTNIWIALAAEIATMIAAKIQHSKIQRQKCSLENEIKRYDIQIEHKKNELINGMINELGKWLDMGEEMSKSILVSFNIKD